MAGLFRAVPDEFADAAISSLEGLQERRGCVQPTGEGAVTVKRQGCFGLVSAEALVFLRHFVDDPQLLIFTAPEHVSLKSEFRQHALPSKLI